jgi:hypothetical protein
MNATQIGGADYTYQTGAAKAGAGVDQYDDVSIDLLRYGTR